MPAVVMAPNNQPNRGGFVQPEFIAFIESESKNFLQPHALEPFRFVISALACEFQVAELKL